MNNIISPKDFYASVTAKSSRGTVMAFIVCMYINAAMSVINFFLVNMKWISVGIEIMAINAVQIVLENLAVGIDFLLFLLLGIFIHIKKNWILALIATCCVGCGMLFTLIGGGGVKGLPMFILGIGTTIVLRNVNKAYKEYITQGIWPQKFI